MFEQTRAKARVIGQYLELPPEQQTAVDSILTDIVFPSFGRDHVYPRWPSYITDDFSPIEFSVSFAPKGAKLRMIFEPLGTEDPIDLPKLRDASAQTVELLRKRWPYELNLTQFNAIKDLFFLDEPRGKLVCWFGVDFGAAPIIKVYLNPQIQKPEKSALQVGEEFMAKLNHGQHEGWLRLREYLTAHPDSAEIEALSTDLIVPERARIKVYVRFSGATLSTIEEALAVTNRSDVRPYVDELRNTFCKGMRMFSGGVVTSGVMITYIFSPTDPKPLYRVHVPLRHYRSDLVISGLVTDFLKENAMERYATGYQKMMQDFSGGSLHHSGFQTYVSHARPTSSTVDLTVYIAPLLFTKTELDS